MVSSNLNFYVPCRCGLTSKCSKMRVGVNESIRLRRHSLADLSLYATVQLSLYFVSRPTSRYCLYVSQLLRTHLALAVKINSRLMRSTFIFAISIIIIIIIISSSSSWKPLGLMLSWRSTLADEQRTVSWWGPVHVSVNRNRF